MRKKEVILDFTSLLDVTLIVLFFFVLFSHLDSEQNRAKAEEKERQLEIEIEEAEKLADQLEEEIQTVRDHNKRQAANLKEMLEFGRSGNIKILMEMKTDEGYIRIIKDEEKITELNVSDDIETEMIKAIETAGYTPADTLFCDFVFDGAEPGTNAAYRKVEKAIDEVRKTYRYFYYSETDTSVGKD